MITYKWGKLKKKIWYKAFKEEKIYEWDIKNADEFSICKKKQL